MGDTDDKFCTIYIIVTILLNHYLLRGGYLDYSSLYAAGLGGDYWSSTPYSSSYAYYLSLYSGGVSASNGYRYSGYSVRCMAAG